MGVRKEEGRDVGRNCIYFYRVIVSALCLPRISLGNQMPAAGAASRQHNNPLPPALHSLVMYVTWVQSLSWSYASLPSAPPPLLPHFSPYSLGDVLNGLQQAQRLVHGATNGQVVDGDLLDHTLQTQGGTSAAQLSNRQCTFVKGHPSRASQASHALLIVHKSLMVTC